MADAEGESMTTTTTTTCTACGKTQEGKSARLPKGWKRVGDDVLCAGCKEDRYRLCAVTIPVVGPLDGNWPALREMLRASWSQSTALANWLTTEMYVRDARRQPADEKLPKYERPYLYPETARFDLPSQTRAAMEQAVSGKYRAKRYEVIWTSEASLPNHRYPYPYAVPNQAWRARWEIGGDGKSRVPVVELPLAGSDGRVSLRLAGGRDYRRQLSAFSQIVSGEAVKGECAIYRVRGRAGDGRNGDKTSEAGRPVWRVLCKMVAYLPRAKKKSHTESRFFALETGSESFLSGILEDREEPWLLHADDFRDQCYQHKRWLARMADDAKHERRAPKRRRAKAIQQYDARGKKFHDRQRSFVQQTVAAIIGFAARSRVTRLTYDDTLQSYMPSFPYFVFRDRLKLACKDAGIEFEHQTASGKVSDKSLANARESLIEEKDQ
jgi:hypothetical protein